MSQSTKAKATKTNKPSSGYLQLVRFCVNRVPDFTPVGGHAQDYAVIACVAFALCESPDNTDVADALPGDVLDVSIATVCAPIIVSSKEDFEKGQVLASRRPCSCRLRTIDSSTVKALHDWIFQYTTAVVKVEQLPEGTTDLPRDFLRGLHAVTEVDLQSTELQTLRRYTLWDCRGLAKVRLPASLTQITDHFMCYCLQLTELDLRHTSLRKIGKKFMEECRTLTAVHLPATLEEIGDAAFDGCQQLQVLDLRHMCPSLRCVGAGFLSGCEQLRTVTFPDSLIVVGGPNVLSGCSAVKEINFENCTALETYATDFKTHTAYYGTTVKLPAQAVFKAPAPPKQKRYRYSYESSGSEKEGGNEEEEEE